MHYRNVFSIFSIVKQILRWVFIILLCILILRIGFIDVFRIPSNSMKTTLLPGDLILVNKFRFGWGSRLWSPGKISRNEVLVFQLKSGYMVKRCIGLPGELFQITNDNIFINNKFLPEIPDIRKLYRLWTGERVATLQQLVKNNLSVQKNEIEHKAQFISLYLNQREYERITHSLIIDSITSGKPIDRTRSFISSAVVKGNMSILIPYKGMRVLLTPEVLNTYREILMRYESIELDEHGLPKYPTHLFQNDYYFFMGDNRALSEDSRSYGIIPYDNIVGSVIWTFR